MTIQAAFAFMQLVRNDPQLQLLVERRGADLTPEELVALGQKHELDFNWDELQSAFRLDWNMRWVRYMSERKPQTLQYGVAEYRD